MKLEIPAGEYAAYIFDCDGTLADTMPLHFRAWTRIVSELGGSMTEELFYELGGKPTVQIFQLLVEEHNLVVGDLDAASALKEAYFEQMIHEIKPIDAVVEIVHRMHCVKPMAVASGGFRSQIEQTLDSLGIRSLFNAIVCVEDTARGKPYPDPFLEAARRLKIMPYECLVFEDSPLGIQAAKAAGMRYVLVSRAGSKVSTNAKFSSAPRRPKATVTRKHR